MDALQSFSHLKNEYKYLQVVLFLDWYDYTPQRSSDQKINDVRNNPYTWKHGKFHAIRMCKGKELL